MEPRHLTSKNDKGFTLIELSIVLVIIGIMLSVGVGLMVSLSKTSKIARERTQLETIENALIAYALSRGRLPGAEGGTTQGNLDYMEINLSTANLDSWVQPYQYAVTDRLTGTNSQNFCRVIYQLQNLYDWFGSPPNAPCNINTAICVTNTLDQNDNGRINSSGQGYYIAAYIFSRGENRSSNGKNNNHNYEYELASNPYDVDNRDDLVQELTFAELSAKICNAQNTVIKVEFTGTGNIWRDDVCNPGDELSGTSVNVASGQSLSYYSGSDCRNITFNELARCDATGSTPGHTCIPGGTPFDGKVKIDTAAGEIRQ